MSHSSSDSEDEDIGPSKEECITKFKEMLKERGVAPFSKWEKELPKIVFDPRFKTCFWEVISAGLNCLASLFPWLRASLRNVTIKDMLTGYPTGQCKLLTCDELTVFISEAIPSQSARRALFEHYVKTRAEEERKEKRAAQKAAIEGFKQLLEEALEVKESLRNDPRYRSVKHEDREVIFNEYVSELKAAEEEVEREAKAKREEQEKLKERERELRKRKEREEQEMERVRLKVRRKEAVTSFQALLVETIKGPQASWTESKPKLEKDPQGRATNSDLDPSDTEKLFREHVKMLYERGVQDFRALLAEVITAEAAAQETEDGKTVVNSWSTAKRLLKPDPRYNKMPRKEREVLWRRYAEDMLRKHKSTLEQDEDRYKDTKSRSSGRSTPGSRRNHERR
ncbi:hypothetical protein Patl1_15737 [Pistacia atlantica]|uniref:Uncharacterized protein n=1 Tax=Pistacia atlantica TaxID=434234 RepID=A0ACC1B9N5_9ROSI|nr:hypothetical protein Patl1_15737 [Pistacia atlantica]